MVVNESGSGYRELPKVQFSLGADANTTDDLAEFNASSVKPHGSLEFNSNELK